MEHRIVLHRVSRQIAVTVTNMTSSSWSAFVLRWRCDDTHKRMSYVHQHSWRQQQKQQFRTHSKKTASVSDTPSATQVESEESSSLQLSPLLSTWYSLTRHISISDILPIGLGNTNELPNHNAFFGDKRLNMHISLLLRTRAYDTDTATNDSRSGLLSSQLLPPVGTVTDIQSIAMSNQLLALHISQILPYHMTTTTFGDICAVIQKNSQIHDAGTMIEAAVDYVSNHTPTASAATIDTALNELAHFLIAKATTHQQHPSRDDRTNDDNGMTDDFHDTSKFMTTDLHNPKSGLLSHGGTVTCQRFERGPHQPAPTFTATAQIIDLTTTVHHGRNQRDTEQSAAAMLWRYYSKNVLANKTNPNSDDDDDDDDIDVMENPKGRILSIGGNVTWEKLPGYPDHLPRFRAVCQKPFFTIPPRNDDDTPHWKHMLEATAEGRTRFEAERIASAIVWQHVMNMTKIPTPDDDDDDDDDESKQKLASFGTNDINFKKKPSKKAVSKSKTVGMEEESESIFDDVFDPQVHKPFKPNRTAREQISQFDQNGFVQFKLKDQPYINLRPGGETVVESWYRGALDPIAAFHRALLAPHIFPNHVGTVNIYTRQNNVAREDEWNVMTANEELFSGHRQEKNAESDTTAAQTENNESLSDTDAATSICSLNGTDTTNPPDDPMIGPIIVPIIGPAIRHNPTYQRTFTVLALVVPNTNHPLIADMTLADFNTNELLTKCFVEYGHDLRETRSTIGLKVNQYIIDTFLRNYENLDEMLEKERKRTQLLIDGLTKAERQNIFFKF